MNRTFTLSLFAVLASCTPKKSQADNTAGSPTPSVDFSWRQHQGDFPADKPGYLILTTEDALTYSKVLPEFVKQKESMGFYVYLATEKDYGSGKTGNAQAAQVRIWLREFQKRTNAKYALLIGDSSPRSGNLPSPTIPDGEHNGLDSAYCDLDGKWVDLYLNTTEKDTRPYNEKIQGSIFHSRALKAGGPRQDELMIGRIAYVGSEIGNSSYDLDRILEKTIRYERDTVAGKNIDWRANALSVTTNYGAGDWDGPLLKAAESEGGTFELRSSRGWIGSIPPENVVDGRSPNAELITQSRRRGLVATCSHGWNRGGEGIASQEQLMRDIDPRYPSAVAVAACTGFALGDNCNLGQAWLRGGGIFAIGTGWSGNNNSRIPFLTSLYQDRVSVGEACRNKVDQYGDPSLHVFPPKGTPLRALQISPALSGHYEERTVFPNTPVKPLTQTYTLTNRSKEAMKIDVETNAPWLTLSATSVELKPDESAQITATSNAKANAFAQGLYVADIRFCREDDQWDDRRLAMLLQPLSLAAFYSFEPTGPGHQFPDLAVAPGFDADLRALWLVNTNADHHHRKVNPGKDRVAGLNAEPQGKVGGALRLDKPAKPWSRGRAPIAYTQWRGTSVSFWFKLGELPAAKQTTPLLSAPCTLSVDAAGLLTFAGGGKPANLGTIKVGDWHFVQLRSDVANRKLKASLDGSPEVLADAPKPPVSGLTIGSFAGHVDELKVWSGELRDADVAKEFAASGNAVGITTPIASTAAPVDDGVLRAPKELPAALDLNDPKVTLDIAGILAANQLSCTLRDAPEWLEFKDGVLSLKPGTDFDRIDFGGYDVILVLAANSGPFAGRVCEHPLKVRIPIPAVRIRIARPTEDTVAFINAGDRYGKPDRPLAKGVIRYTTDGSPVNADSEIYSQPFTPKEGMKITARFFYLGEYPMASVTANAEFGVSREKWKPIWVSGDAKTRAAAASIFDAKSDTAWTHKGETMPQGLAWDLGEPVKVAALSCHSTIADQLGRIRDYVLHASDDNKKWRQVHSGTYANSPTVQRIELAQPFTARYLKLEVTSLHGGKDMVINEVEVFSR